MVADLSLHSLSSKGEANERQVDPDSVEGSWTWNPSNVQDEEPWEVRAFAEDTSSVMGMTWPPRSYTCTFCRREFRSSQALGGHTNVHRKDRARIKQSQFLNLYYNSMSTSSSSLVIPNNQELGLCVMYPNGLFPRIKMIVPCLDPSSSSSSKAYNLRRHSYPQGNIERSTQWISCGGQSVAYKGKCDSLKSVVNFKDRGNEELDLELRLGK